MSPTVVQTETPFTVSIVLDHGTYPLTSADVGSLSGLFFSLQIHSSFNVLSHALSAEFSEGTPLVSNVSAGPNGVSLAYFGTSLEPSYSRSVLELTLVATEVGEFSLGFEPSDAADESSARAIIDGRPVAPYTSGAAVICTTLPVGQVEVLPMTAPTAEQLVPQWLDDSGSAELGASDMASSASSSSGGPEGGGGTFAGPGGDDDYCELTGVYFAELASLLEQDSDDDVDEVNLATSIPDPLPVYSASVIQAAYDNAISNPGTHIVHVGPGIYVGQLNLDVSSMAAASVYIVSQYGPEATIIQPDRDEIVVKITGAPPAFAGGLLSLGFTEYNDQVFESPLGTPGAALSRGWHGFTIRDGRRESGFGTYGAGVHVETTVAQLDIRGNFVLDNGVSGLDVSGGGGLYVLEAGEGLNVFANDFSSNEATDGAGLYFETQVAVDVKVIRNYIHHNLAAVDGGGLYSEQGLELCGNVIFENTAVNGCGAFCEANPSASALYFIEDNYFHHNAPYTDDVRGFGGGIAIVGPSPSTDASTVLAINRNRIYRNGKIDPDSPSNTGLVREGGGLYLSFTTTADGPLLATSGYAAHFIANNAIYENHASQRGGGIYYSMNSSFAPVDAPWNTVWQNLLHDTTAGEGAGLYVAEGFGTNLVLVSMILKENWLEDSFSAVEENWFFEAPMTFSPDNFDYICTTNDDATSPSDIIAPMAWTGLILAANPLFQSVGLDYELMCHQTGSSPTIDTGDPFPLLTPYNHLEFDFDFEDRILDGDNIGGARTDMGADERPFVAEFKRGDANGDGGVDIADVIFTTNHLFVAGSPSPDCEDAMDSNDDGDLEVADAVYLVNALFVPGSPAVPSPNPGCGADPTSDNLGCRLYMGCP